VGRALRLLSCLAVASLAALAFVGARADANEAETIDWAQNYCWQTGQLGAEAEQCQDPAEAGFLASHTIDDAGGAQKFRQSQQGHYCSYKGIATALRSEETPAFETLSPPGSYQMGDGYGNVCAAWWAPPTDPVRWGLQLGDPSSKAECVDIDPNERCSIERYLALATEAEINARSAKDYPWASYLGEPTLDLQTGNFDEVLAFDPGSHGSAWGYRCPVLEDRTSGNIMELCLEEWRGFGATCLPEPWPCSESYWQYDRAAECHQALPGFEHSYDRLVLPSWFDAQLLDSELGEPLKETETPPDVYPVRTGFRPEVDIGREAIRFAAELDNKPYKEAPGHENMPEIGYGCGRESSDPSSTNSAEWALIGVATGIEEWETEHARGEGDHARGEEDHAGEEGVMKTQLGEGFAWTAFKPLSVEISNESATSEWETEAVVTAEINPFGFDTDYYVVYESASDKYKSPVMSAGSGVNPVHVSVVLRELSPHTKYGFHVVAYRVNEEVDGGALYYGEDSSFTTWPLLQCMGANIKALGATLQAPAQVLWADAFNTSTYTSACSGSQGSGGKPRVEYASSGANAGSGACMRAFGAEGATPNYGEYLFCGTEEPPNAREKAEVESHRDGGEAESLETIPVAQEALAVVVHLPKDCVASSEIPAKKGKFTILGRLALDQEVIEGIYRGTIRTWAQAITAQNGDGHDELSCSEGGENDVIRPVVPAERSGTTHIFKEFLAQVHAGSWGAEAFHMLDGEALCDGARGEDLEAGAPESWEAVAEGCENQRWPQAAQVLRASGSGDRGVGEQINATESSIGFAGLAVAQELQFFNPQGGGGERVTGEQNKEFWAVVQNIPGKTPATFEDPSVRGDSSEEGEANCKETKYVAARGEEFPPKSTRYVWSGVKGENVSTSYPICGITYDLTLAEYEPYLSGLLSAQAGRERTITTQNYLRFVASEGSKMLENRDYAAVAKDVKKEAERGAAEIAYTKRCELMPRKKC